jgi:hypothetical protein
MAIQKENEKMKMKMKKETKGHYLSIPIIANGSM